MGIQGFVDEAAGEKCYSTAWSFGEICVGCGCCAADPMTRVKARIAYHRTLLHNDRHFNGWYEDDPEILELQKRNVAENIAWNKAKLKELRKELRELRREHRYG